MAKICFLDNMTALEDAVLLFVLVVVFVVFYFGEDGLGVGGF